MQYNFDDIVETFWLEYDKATIKEEYLLLLKQMKLYFTELLDTLEGEEFLTFYDESPLFAMISEVHRICPIAVIELAEKDRFFSTALELFSGYSEEKRDILRDLYLNKPNLHRFK